MAKEGLFLCTPTSMLVLWPIRTPPVYFTDPLTAASGSPPPSSITLCLFPCSPLALLPWPPLAIPLQPPCSKPLLRPTLPRSTSDVTQTLFLRKSDPSQRSKRRPIRPPYTSIPPLPCNNDNLCMPLMKESWLTLLARLV